jgi:hypothetical protein
MMYDYQQEFKDTTGVIRIPNRRRRRQHNTRKCFIDCWVLIIPQKYFMHDDDVHNEQSQQYITKKTCKNEGVMGQTGQRLILLAVISTL